MSLLLQPSTSFANFAEADTYINNNPSAVLTQRFFEMRTLIGDTARLFLPNTNWNEDLPIINQAVVLYPSQTTEILDYFQHRYDLLRGL